MDNITTELITRLSKNESITEIFRSELEFSINILLKSIMELERGSKCGMRQEFDVSNSKLYIYIEFDTSNSID